MPAIKIRMRIDEALWAELKALAEGSRRGVSHVLTEAVQEYVRRRRMRPEVLQHLEESIARNEKLGELLDRFVREDVAWGLGGKD